MMEIASIVFIIGCLISALGIFVCMVSWVVFTFIYEDWDSGLGIFIFFLGIFVMVVSALIYLVSLLI